MDGTIPNLSYLPEQEFTIISPEMANVSLNQPSVFNGYLILAGDGDHEVWDISNPYAPSYCASMETQYNELGESESHQVTYGKKGDEYYLATISGEGIDIWNVTDTTSPTLEAELKLPGIYYGDVAGAIWGLSWQGNYLYVGATTNGLYVVDVTDPSSPELVSELTRSELGGVSAGPVFVLGDMLVVTTPKVTAGIATVDISNPLRPRLLDSVLPTNVSYIGGFYGTHATLIGPFRTYDVTTDPRNIVEQVTNLGLASEYVSYANDALFLGGIRTGTQGIWKYDLSNLSRPVLEGTVPGRYVEGDDQFSCPIGNLVAIADDNRANGKYVGAVLAVHDTEPDNEAIGVMASYPADGTTGVSLSGNVTLSLTEWPEFATVNQDTFFVRNALTGAVVSGDWGCTYTTLSFSADAPLDPLTTYEVVLPAGGVTDLVGNAVTDEFVSQFTTEDETADAVLANVVQNSTHVTLGEVSHFSIANPVEGTVYQWETEQDYTGTSVSHQFSEVGRHQVFLTSAPLTTVKHEAEAADIKSGTSAASYFTGYSGAGYVDFGTGQTSSTRIAWNITTPYGGVTDLVIRHATNADRPVNLVVNGEYVHYCDLQSTGGFRSWADYVVPAITFNPGLNVVEIRADAGSEAGNFDYISFEVPENPQTVSFTHTVHRPLSEGSPTHSGGMVLNGDLLWAVNPDAGSVSAIHKSTLELVHEIAVSEEPKSIAVSPSGTLWVTCRQGSNIDIVDPVGGRVSSQIALPYASRPSGIAFAPDQSAAIVTLEATGQVLRLDPGSGGVTHTLTLPTDADGVRPEARAIAIDHTSSYAYVTRLISPDSEGQVYVIDLSDFTLDHTIALAKSTGTDSNTFARGLPNYLTAIRISPDGERAWVPSKKDNIDRGSLTDGLALDHDNTVRAITSAINTVTSSHEVVESFDFDNMDRCHSVCYSPYGEVAFISMPGNDLVQAVNAYNGEHINSLITGSVPTDVCLDSDTEVLYVLNFLSRSVSAYDVSELLSGGARSSLLGEQVIVSTEPLDAQVLLGKKIFYNASSRALNMEGYMSCASCHLDGGHDGRTWDFGGPSGEGLRNTIDLRGRAGVAHGRLHWTGNFDEVHDFENQIRSLGLGEGLMDDADFSQHLRSESLGRPKSGLSADLDALAAYVTSLSEVPRSPYRNTDGEMTSEARLGREVFLSVGCADCHGGEHFTDSMFGLLHDVGTISDLSGDRLGESLAGFDTPTLRGVWATAPYLHDGSAPTLRDVLVSRNIGGAHGNIADLSASELDQLLAYLHQIDDLNEGISELESDSVQPFQEFAEAQGVENAAESDDLDQDGWNNLFEFALGGSQIDNKQSQPEQQSRALHAEDIYEISWLYKQGGVWLDNTRYQWGDLIYTPEMSVDLENWGAEIESVESPDDLEPAPLGYEWSTVRLKLDTQTQVRGFVRLKLEQQ